MTLLTLFLDEFYMFNMHKTYKNAYKRKPEIKINTRTGDGVNLQEFD